MHVWNSVKEIQFLCERLDFRHICFLKKFLFLHRLLDLIMQFSKNVLSYTVSL